MSIKSINLAYREGNSDKVYSATIEEQGSGYVVNAAWGRRGQALQTGSKTPKGPVSLPMAESILAKLQKEKEAKGYKSLDGEAPVLVGGNERAGTGLRPQLLNEISDAEKDALLDDLAYVMQEKFDGKRVLVIIEGGEIKGANRKGEEIPLPAEIVAELNTYEWTGRNVLDGELVGVNYHIFDVLWLDGVDVRSLPYTARFSRVEMSMDDDEHVFIVETASTKVAKHMLMTKLAQVDASGHARAEGVVFKRGSAAYTSGRPNSGGDQLKWKFWATADVIVANGRDGKRSAGMALLDANHNPVFVGNVSVPANYDLPTPGQVAQVRYLYAYKGGSLYQPQYEGARDDKTPDECTLAQLKYKAGDAEEN